MPYLRSIALAAAVLCVAAPAAYALSPTDFATRATVSNTFEIQSSQLALQRSKDTAVTGFAHEMIDDHTRAATDMQAALTSDALAAPPGALDAAHQKQLDALSKAPDSGFDAAYIAAQKAAHVEAIGLFRTYSESGQLGALKTFATTTLPVLQRHDEHIRTLKPAR